MAIIRLQDLGAEFHAAQVGEAPDSYPDQNDGYGVLSETGHQIEIDAILNQVDNDSHANDSGRVPKAPTQSESPGPAACLHGEGRQGSQVIGADKYVQRAEHEAAQADCQDEHGRDYTSRSLLRERHSPGKPEEGASGNHSGS